MELLLKDIRFGIRMLVKQPAVTLIAVTALTLGIGLTTTMFSIVYGALIRGLPFEDSQRLVHVERTRLSENIQSMEVTIHDYLDYRAQQRSFEDLAAFYTGTVNVSGTEGRPDRYNGAFITAGAFPLIRTQPLMGRTFREGEDTPSAEPVILLGYGAWQSRFGGDPNVVGRTVRVNGETMTVIGVMPEGFAFPIQQEVWVPLRLDPLRLKRGEPQLTLEVFGRLKDGVTLDQASAEMAGIAKRLELEHKESNQGIGTILKPYTEEFIGREPTALLYTMLGGVFGVLLIACANVANLLLARAAVRSKEVAVRTALGASRLRVITQLLAEAFVLAAVGGILGLGVAAVGVRMFNRAIAGADPPFWIDIKVDPTVMLFVLGLTLVATLLAGLVPALRASGGNVSEVLKDEARGSSSFRLGRLSRALVIGEVALSCGLLVPAGLMIKSVTKLKTTDYGFATTDVFTARVGLFEATYPDTLSRLRLWEDLVRRLDGKPGVQSVALTTSLPTSGSGGGPLAVEGVAYSTDRDQPNTRMNIITPAYFRTFGVDLRQGRDFTWGDDANNLQVAIVNQSFARTHFPGQDPVGKRVRMGRVERNEGTWRTIVGVVPDMWLEALDDDDPAGMYVPLAQTDARFMSVAVRAQGDAMALTSLVRDQVAAAEPDLPIYFVRRMDEVIRLNGWFYGVFGTLFMIFGFAALFLASVGLYGVMAFAVRRRTQEVGVRMALGAQSGDILRMILWQGLVQLVVGVTIGLGLAFWLSRALRIILFRVESTDPTIFVAIVLTLGITGLIATLVPARRATQVDPVWALRYE